MFDATRMLHQIVNSGDAGRLAGRALDIWDTTAEVGSPKHGAEVHGSSLLTVDPPSPPENIYLHSFAEALGLEPRLVDEIHTTAETTGEVA
jgi:uncharacterized membrane protein YebE (DUF533 family)